MALVILTINLKKCRINIVVISKQMFQYLFIDIKKASFNYDFYILLFLNLSLIVFLCGLIGQ